MKKYIISISIFLLIVICILLYLYIDSYKVKEDYKYVVINKEVILKVYDKQKVSDFITITSGKILTDKDFDTSEIGNKKIEILYLNKNNRKRKAYIDYQVIDDTPPIILGGLLKTLKKGSNTQLEHLFLSADNYDKTPKREIIGDYDINNIGEYSLTLKLTDSSNNITTKDFTLKVVDKVTESKSNNTTLDYIEVYKKHKTENNKIGLDISKWQGTIDFTKLLENNVEFVMLRIGYQKGYNGTNEIDPYFYENIKKLNELNIPVGVYFYSYATSTKESEEQALWVIDKIKDYKISLPISFDFESWNDFSSLNLSLYDINDIAKTFLETVKNNNYRAMNYSSKFYLENIWNIDTYPVWLAHYTTQTDYNGNYVMWQLCNNGRITGIKGDVDIDILYDPNMMK